jgi:hypothetical protein
MRRTTTGNLRPLICDQRNGRFSRPLMSPRCLAFTLGACTFIASLGASSLTAAQDAQILMPEQSAAKAKQLIDETVSALGGSAYLGIQDISCTGRLSQFDHSGGLMGYEKFIDFSIPPDKERTENLPQRNIIEVYNGNMGWDLDRGGVSEASATDVIRQTEDEKIDLFNVLRNRVHEPGMILRYAGQDIVDLHDVNWVELIDQDDHTIRLALSQDDHLPVRKVVETIDPNTRTKTTEIEYYSNFHPLNGIQTAFQLTRERNGIKIYQVFFEKCDYNSGVSDSLFTKESLDERWNKIGKKPKEKKKGKDDGN